MSRKLYVEGGGDSKSLKVACRRGFRRFLEKAGVQRQPGIVACGSRDNAYGSFCTARDQGRAALLLVDAEAPVRPGDPWKHLHSQDGWKRPSGAGESQCHLMVQVMESWFLADPDALATFYGPSFTPKHLPASPDIEKVPKKRVLRGLAKASRRTRKGKYDKGPDSFKILEALNPDRVEAASHHARRFLDTLRNAVS